MRFTIRSWAACAPGLGAHDDWLAWARAPWLPAGEADAPLSEMPAMLRRRLGPLGRMAVQAAWRCQPQPGLPVVFASRYGDAARALALLRSFALAGEMSPTDFALSVHNAIGAMSSIARQDTTACTSIAAGVASPAAGLVEAAGLLADGAGEVLLVCYDAPLPAPYGSFDDEPPCAWAWAWRVALPAPGEASIGLAWEADAWPAAVPAQEAAAVQDAAVLPFGLAVHRFALAAGAPPLTLDGGGTRWTWSYHA